MVTGANITCVMDNLEKEGFEANFSKEDRRVILADLTASGKTKIGSIMPKYTDNIAALTSVLVIRTKRIGKTIKQVPFNFILVEGRVHTIHPSRTCLLF